MLVPCAGVPGGMLLYVDASKRLPFYLKVSLRTPGGGKGAAQNNEFSYTKSRTCLRLGAGECFTVVQGFG